MALDLLTDLVANFFSILLQFSLAAKHAADERTGAWHPLRGDLLFRLLQEGWIQLPPAVATT
jgi:hypothetical protein